MNRFLLLIISILYSFSIYSQQDPQFSHNMFNILDINPGFAGCNGKKINATALQRQQWMGLDGAPKNTLLSIDMPIKPFGYESGLGITIYNDIIAFDKNFNAKLAYSYHQPVWAGTLGIGIEVGLYNRSLDAVWNGENVTTDPLIPPAKGGDMTFDLGLGTYYYTEQYYLGFSVDHLHRPKIKLEGDNGKSSETSLHQHFYLTGGYTFETPVSLLEVIPSVFIKSDGVTTQMDLNANVLYNKKIWGGVTYRFQDAFIALFGFELFNGLKLGIAYDITTSKLAKYSNGSFEILLGYSFNLDIPKVTQKYKSVRFL